MKRLTKTVKLSFFNDDATGEWGLCHTDTQDDNNDTAFNAFWGGVGIFHDVFEHSHEHQNKYFKNDYAMNVGGEMAAMGAMWYYYNQLGVSNRMNANGYRSPSESMKETTLSEVQETISQGYCRYGYTLESNVPKQRPVYDSELEYQIEDFWKKVKALPTVKSDYNDEQEYEFAKGYKQSVTFRKIADLHRYGYRLAEKIVPDNHENRITLYNFLDVWENFCKSNSAEEMQKAFKGVTIKLYKENDLITWKAIFKSAYPSEIKTMVLTEKTLKHFTIENSWIMESAY